MSEGHRMDICRRVGNKSDDNEFEYNNELNFTRGQTFTLAECSLHRGHLPGSHLVGYPLSTAQALSMLGAYFDLFL